MTDILVEDGAVEIKLDAFEMRSLQYVSEKQQRIVADEKRMAYEKTEAARESNEIVGAIQKKYGITLSEYAILPNEGLLRRR
jgi:hypothetical protein